MGALVTGWQPWCWLLDENPDLPGCSGRWRLGSTWEATHQLQTMQIKPKWRAGFLRQPLAWPCWEGGGGVGVGWEAAILVPSRDVPWEPASPPPHWKPWSTTDDWYTNRVAFYVLVTQTRLQCRGGYLCKRWLTFLHPERKAAGRDQGLIFKGTLRVVKKVVWGSLLVCKAPVFRKCCDF